jgi:predicted TIM-barrel enzyme
MSGKYTRQDVIDRLRGVIEDGEPIYTVGVGTGISAKFSERGGADLLSTYPIAKYRMSGFSSMSGYLPLCDSNGTTLEMGRREILPVTEEVPVAAGLLGNDITREMDKLLDQVKEAGFAGILNCPTIALVDGSLRQDWEETGITFEAEVEMTRLARERDLFTHCFCTSKEEAEAMIEAGCDMVVAHLGNSVGGTVGSETAVPLEEAVEWLQDMCSFVKARDPDVMVVCHGGPVAYPDDFQYVYERVEELDGFMGGSSGERFPVEEGIADVTEEFKAVRR